MKIRMKFSKDGVMKFVGHLDTMRYFQKVMRRAGVDICYSGGFSPHQIMSFAAPLGVGITSSGEYVDLEVHTSDSSEEMLRRINEAMVEGTRALEWHKLPDDANGAMSLVAAADYRVTFRDGKEPSDWPGFLAGIPKFLALPEIVVTKQTKKGSKEWDIRPLIYQMRAQKDGIWMQISAGSLANLRPEAVILAYANSRAEELKEFALMIHREEVYADMGTEGERRLGPLGSLGVDLE